MRKSLADQARAVVAAHERLALTAGAEQRLARLLAQNPPVDLTQALYSACLALDFWPLDAQCIASAWQRQSQRLNGFEPGLWPTQAQDFGLSSDAASTSPNDAGQPSSGGAFAPCPKQLGLYAVLPSAAWVARMAQAGLPTLQLRFKSSAPKAIEQEVQAAVAAVQGSSSKLFINDHWQAAMAAGAYGVHLGQEDVQALSQAELMQLQSAGLRLGLSSHGYHEMLRAASIQPSYIALGAVFATTLKRMATPPQGLARLGVYVQLLRQLPTVAIGGIDLNRLPKVLASGVGAVAVVRAITDAAQPEAAAKALLQHMAASQCH